MGIKSVPEINPRQKMTKKARRAIDLYVNVHAEKHGRLQYLLIKWVLQAERMRREKLYLWCKSNGYRWKPHKGWVK